MRILLDVKFSGAKPIRVHWDGYCGNPAGNRITNIPFFTNKNKTKENKKFISFPKIIFVRYTPLLSFTLFKKIIHLSRIINPFMSDTKMLYFSILIFKII